MRSFTNYVNRLHPVTLFLYCLVLFVCLLLASTPAFLLADVVLGAFYYGILYSPGRLLRSLAYLLPLSLVLILSNALFNHRGKTILFYLNDRPITLESIWYGGTAALLILSLVLWFQILGQIFGRERFLYLFGGIFPTTSLMCVMTLGFLPKARRRLDQIWLAAYHPENRKSDKVSSPQQHRTHFHKGVHTLLWLTSVSLEQSIETALSMKARGYGLEGRTQYHRYRFSSVDLIFGLPALALAAGCGICWILPAPRRLLWFLTLLYLLLPALYQLEEGGKRWLYWKYKT